MEDKKKINLDKPALKYREEYDLQIYEHLINGYSLSSFTVKPMVYQSTIFDWLKDHESFGLAAARGRAEFLMRLETLLLHLTFGTPLTEKQKTWMPKGNLKAVTYLLSRRYRQEYGRDFNANGKALEESRRPTSITFIEVPGRVPTKKDPLTGAPIRPDVIVEASEVAKTDE